jgi:hypothetical protein
MTHPLTDTMIRMYPKAAVLTNRHPFGGTDMMAQSLASALTAVGYDPRIVNQDDASLQALGSLLGDPDLRLIITTGTVPLSLRVAGQPVWRAMRPDVQFITYIVDAWPYDHVRVAACREFERDWQRMPNLHLASLEGNDARLIGPRAHHMPTGSYPAPWRVGPKQHADRLMVWGSANKELSVTPVHDAFEDTLADNNPWGLDPARRRTVAERLRHTTVTHGLTAIADAMDMPVGELVVEPAMVALCALDSTLKRYRRVKVVKALRGLPVDIYGENWGQHVGDEPSFRLLTPNPNHNHAFSYLCQHYAGLVNFDPNFGDGTNERAISALAMGVAIANNFNLRTNGLDGVIPYHFNDESIRSAAVRLLSHQRPVPTPAGHSWEALVGQLLRQVAESSAGVALASAQPAPQRSTLPMAA